MSNQRQILTMSTDRPQNNHNQNYREKTMSIKPWLIAMTTLVACHAGATAGAADLQQAIIACKQQNDNFARLNCYDQIGAQVSAQVVTPVANPQAKPVESISKPIAPQIESNLRTSSAQVTVAPVQVISQPTAEAIVDDFGRTKSRPSDDLQQITGKVKALSTNNQRKLIITLENGQAWRQTDSDSLSIKVGNNVNIEKAAFGSFLLNVEGSNRKIRVKRVE